MSPPRLGALAISIMPIGWALAIDVVTTLRDPTALVLRHSSDHGSRKGEAQGFCAETSRKDWMSFDILPAWASSFSCYPVTVLVVMPAFPLLPMLVKQHFGSGAAQVALMEGLSGTGMVVAGLAIAAMGPRGRLSGFLSALPAPVLGIALTALVPGNLFGVAVTWWVISGICFIFGDAPLTALLQTMVPNHMQGRVLSILNTLMNLAAPVGLLVISPLGDIFGVRSVFVIAGVLGAVVSVSGFLSRDLLSLGRESRGGLSCG